jgi:hypothetical protein
VSLWAAPAAALAVAWLWFLARGKAAGAVKRLAFRATLLAALAGLVALASVRGVFARTSAGFQAILLLALVGVELGYLYTTRFCPRCGAQLPRHGMTSELRRLQPTEPRRGRNGAQ